MAYSSFSDSCSLFEEQVSTFKHSAASVVDVLHGMISTIEGGMIPSTEHINIFQSMLHDLQEYYDKLYQTATSLLDGIDLQNKYVSIKDIEEAVQALKEQVHRKFHETEHVLIEFLTVEAEVASYMDALQSWRTRASELAERIRDHQLYGDSLDESVRQYRLFLKAMDIEDSEEKEKLFNEQIDKLFSPIVSRGLYSRKYYRRAGGELKKFIDEGTDGDKAAPSEMPVPFQAEAVFMSVVNKMKPSRSEKNIDTSLDAGVYSSEVESMDSDADISCIKESNEIVIHRETPADSGVSIHRTYRKEKEQSYNRTISENIINIGTFSKSSDIKSFIKNNNKKHVIHLLNILKTFCIITVDQILNFGHLYGKFNNIPEYKITSILMLLTTKKIIKKITYHPSLWVITSFNKNRIDNILRELNINCSDIVSTRRAYAEKIAEANIHNTVAQHECLMRYLLGVKKYYPTLLPVVLDTVELYNESVEVAVVWGQERYICSLALREETLNSESSYHLFVPTPEEGLPALEDASVEVTCFAFYEGMLYRWKHGWQSNHTHKVKPIYSISVDADNNDLGENIADVEAFDVTRDKAKNVPAETSDHAVLENGEQAINDRCANGGGVCRDGGEAEQELTTAFNVSIQEFDVCGHDVGEFPSEEVSDLRVSDMTETVSEEKKEGTERQDIYAPSGAEEGRAAEETVEQMAARLSERDIAPSGEEIVEIVTRLSEHYNAPGLSRISNVVAQALMLLKAAALQGLPGCVLLYEQFTLATGTAQGVEKYAGYNLNKHFTAENYSQSLMLAAYMYALFTPNKHDFTLQNQAKMYLQEYETYFPDYPTLKPLFAALCGIHDVEPNGFTLAVLTQLENDDGKAAFMYDLQRRAKRLMREPVVTVHLHGIPELLSNCFGHKSDYYACMEIIAQNRLQDKDILEAVLQETYELYGESYELSEKHLEDTIDSAWSVATKKQSTKRLPLKMVARRQIREAFLERMELMKEWIESAVPLDSGRVDRLRKLKNSILQALKSLPLCEKEETVEYAWVVSYMTENLVSRLDQRVSAPLFADALRTGFVSLDDRFQPILEKEMCEIPYYEPWRRVLKHIADRGMTLETAEKAISADPDSPMFDNLHQQELLARLRGEDIRESNTVEKAETRAKDKTKNFKGSLELAYAAGRITEQDKEDLLQMLFCEEDFLSRRDFGCWKQFLEALDSHQKAKVASHKRELEEQITHRRVSGRVSSILDTAERLLNDGQFAVAEEYVNIFDRNDSDNSKEIENVFDEDNHLEEFLLPKNFDLLYNYSMNTLRGRALRKGGPEFLKKHFPVGWTSAYKEESIRFVQSWPNAKAMTQEHDIFKLMEAIGITVSEVRRRSNKKEDIFELCVKPVPCDFADYPHPIAAFGTEIKSPLIVVALYGGKQAKDIIDTVNQLKPSGHSMTVILLDYALSRSMRCQLAELCHQASGLAPFIVIDRVLALYLALHLRSERMSILLNCALPYAFALQPFVRDGGPTSAEMFCGRTRELLDILNLKGAALIYGGRQLGKTALLQRAQGRFHNPANNDYAIFYSIKEKSEEAELVENLVNEVNKQTFLGIQSCNTMKSFCEQLESLFHKGRIQSMLLLLDEADNFLRSANRESYASIQPLVDLRRICPRFKFVFAGLNNVYRASNATINNGVLGQIGHPLCIRPLSPADALRLILRPLRYLGVRQGKNAHLETILSSTNYYPGILQFVGYKLTESLNSNSSRYYRAGNETPPILLTSEHLGSIMAEDELNESIKDKFRLSLKMDKRYFMLARCIGMLYHFEEPMYDNYKGYTVIKIKKMADDYDIYCLKGLDIDEYESLLDEMFEMGILHRAIHGVYRLRKRSFLDIIGSDIARLENEIISENERNQNR